MSSATAPRRSKRSKTGMRQQRPHWSRLSAIWRRMYIDVGHVRLQKCITAWRNASDHDIRQLPHGTCFLAVAISACSVYGASKEDKLLEYAHVVTERGVDANDNYNGNSAIVLAAYHGYIRLVQYLLDLGCSLASDGSYGNAIQACVRNSQYEALEMLMKRRYQDAALFFLRDGFSWDLYNAIRNKRDVMSVRILTSSGAIKPTMNDARMTQMLGNGRDVRCLFPILRELYPTLSNVASWDKKIHWSFPTSDRHAINLLWHSEGTRGRVFPGEIWLHIFSFVGRGWFARETTLLSTV